MYATPTTQILNQSVLLKGSNTKRTSKQTVQQYEKYLEAKCAAKKWRYEEDLKEIHAAKRQKYNDNLAAIKASERSL